VWQHLVSLWPTTSFGVSFHPVPSVRRLTEKEPEVPVPTTHRPLCLAIADRDGDARWVREVMTPRLGSPPVNEVPPTPGGPSWWGTERLVEAVAYPIDVPVVARRILRGLSFQSCRWCGESVGAEVCPFCGIDRSPLEFAGDAA
jgi:hypothetical protein